jgi:hypothetical protein
MIPYDASVGPVFQKPAPQRAAAAIRSHGRGSGAVFEKPPLLSRNFFVGEVLKLVDEVVDLPFGRVPCLPLAQVVL